MRLRAFTYPVVLACALLACEKSSHPPPPVERTAAPPPDAGPRGPTPQDAKDFVAHLNEEMKDLMFRAATADWIKSTYITDDTERNDAWANEKLMAYTTQAIQQSMRFKGLTLDPDTDRALYLLRVGSTLPAPTDPQKRQELADLSAKLEGLYGKGKYCGKDGKGKCRDLIELEKVMAKSHNYDELLDAWAGWRTTSREMRPLYAQLVKLSNVGAKEIGFPDTGTLWRSGYDMAPDAFAKDTDRLWEQVKPLYEQLHCYVRGRLAKTYGEAKLPKDGTLPAHLLGNMWAQEWGNIYPLVTPYPGGPSLDVDAAIKKKMDWKKMVQTGESFFVSLGLDPLPKSFWENSLFLQPKDRDVVCHASAWDVNYAGDLRLKVCIQPTEEDLITIHHELGHIYYYHAYDALPVSFQAGANDGFHEAIGDAIALSITPAYLKQIGLLAQVPNDQKGLINVQMKEALDKVAFLPFGKFIDEWRWDVFSGKVTPESYNASWWELIKKYQGITPPVERSEADFDPGAKYHIAGNVPYMRYFLARILQFQFHRAMCRAAGFKGPLYECSVYGNKEAGRALNSMLKLGASKPWPEALYTMTGERQMDAGALLEYFQPLADWLKEQNKGQKCGW